MKNVFLLNMFWMGWNLILAFLPLIISLIVFRKKIWINSSMVSRIILVFFVGVFYFFLPNCPYILTDIIHFVRQIKDYRYFNLDDNKIIIFLIPQYIVFIFLGFSFYVISFQKMLHFLADCNWNIIIIWLIKIINPVLMSIGVFLGRFYRFNTWDIFSNYESIIKSTIEGFSNLDFTLFIILNSIIIFFGFEILSIFYKSLFKGLFILTKNDSIISKS